MLCIFDIPWKGERTQISGSSLPSSLFLAFSRIGLNAAGFGSNQLSTSRRMLSSLSFEQDEDVGKTQLRAFAKRNTILFAYAASSTLLNTSD